MSPAWWSWRSPKRRRGSSERARRRAVKRRPVGSSVARQWADQGRLFEAAFLGAPLAMALLEPRAPFRIIVANDRFAALIDERVRADGLEGATLEEAVPGAVNSGLEASVIRVAAGHGVETTLD